MGKHKLLREDILPAMASNRKVQRLLNEFMDLLSEYESTDTNPERKEPVSPTTSTPPTDQMDSAPPPTNEMDAAPPAAHQIDTAPRPPATDQMDSTTTSAADHKDSAAVEVTQTNSISSAATDQINLEQLPLVTDQVNLTPAARDSGS